MNKRIKPKAEYSLEVDGKEIKKSPSSTVRETVESEPVLITTKWPRIKPKADYSVETND